MRTSQLLCLFGKALCLHGQILPLLRQRMVSIAKLLLLLAVLNTRSIIVWDTLARETERYLFLETLGVYLHLLSAYIEIVKSCASATLSSLWRLG